ncbi:MAG: hypothetical protein WCG25_09380 [bacterium]
MFCIVSTVSSVNIGIGLFIIGIRTLLQTNFLYLLSFGFTKSATSENIVSGLVVHITIESFLVSIKYLILYFFP